MRITSFKPIVSTKTETLILGTIPGNKSLHLNEYYAHESNHFWDILFLLNQDAMSLDIYGADKSQNEKLTLLDSCKLGLWDVLKSCERKGSSDAKIKDPILNDFESFLNEYKSIKYLFFNGKTAFEYFKKENQNLIATKEIKVLNSTSTANRKNTFMILKEWKNAYEDTKKH
jgi:hypoxanthine-DNA glycosylase